MLLTRSFDVVNTYLYMKIFSKWPSPDSFADVLDVSEHPCLDAKLYRACNHRRYNLRPEHRTRWDFHVMAELEIGGKL